MAHHVNLANAVANEITDPYCPVGSIIESYTSSGTPRRLLRDMHSRL